MTNGTERDEPGRRSEDGPQGTGPAESSRPSSDPVWPVWGGGTTEPEATDEQPSDEAASDASAADEAASSDAAVDEGVSDEAAPDASATDEAAPDATTSDEAASSDAAVDESVSDEAAPDESALDAPAPDAADEPATGEQADADEPVAAESVVDDEAVSDDAAVAQRAAEPLVDDEAAPDEPAGAEQAAAEPLVDDEAVPDEPAGAEQAAAEPLVDDETASDQPATEGPVADASVADDAPVSESGSAEVAAEPVVDEPEAADDLPDVPAADDEAVDEPVTVERAADEPATDEPRVADEPATDELVADEPTTDELVADEPTTDEPRVADEPTTDESVTDELVTGEPLLHESAADDEVGRTASSGDGGTDGTDESRADAQDVTTTVADEAPSEDVTADALTATDDATAEEVTDPEPATAAAPVETATETETATDAGSGTDAAADADADADAGTAEPTAATTPPAAGAAPAATAPTEPPAGRPGGRDDATAVIAPVVPTPPSTPAPTPPPPVGTLAAPVTRTVPGPTPAAVAPTPAGPVPPSVTAAAGAAAAAATSKTDVGKTATGTPEKVTAETASAAATAPTEALPPTAAAPAAASAARTQPQQPVKAQPPIASGPVPPSNRPESPLDVFEAEDGKRRWPKRLLIVAGVVVALGAVYVGASYALADKVPRGATVAGVDIGGLSSDDAVAQLDAELADATTQPIEVVANDVQATVDPVAAGLAFDSQATVDELTGVDLADPARLWAHLAGVGAQDPVTSVDDEALSAAIGDLGTSLALAPVDGTVVFVDATPQSTAAVDGWDLDQAGAAEVLAADWLVAARPIELPTATVAPDITQEETDAALAEAQQVTSAPVTVAAEGRTALLDAATLAANASFVPTDGKLVLQMNGDGLTEVVLAQLPDLLTQSADAHFEFVNDAPVIVPGIPGTSLDPAALAASVAAATAAADRTAPVELVQADPSESTAELEALGVKEIVSEFSTPLNSEPRRTVNITNGASKISGTLIRPGETFSLTEALGPIDAAHGYVEAGAIVSGEHTDAWGGGLSQVSTTTYNAAFLAGFEDVEHRPHSEWFSRYPEGREATIFTGTLDMRWKNNTPYGALVQAWVSGGRVYVRVWGTKYWTVESITSPRSGVVSPTTVYSQSPTCEAQSAGNPGFSVTVTRKTYLNGTLEKTESNSWRYKPQNKVICGPPPTATPPATAP